jgi:hypothetical protein
VARVNPALREYIIRRDGGCCAVYVNSMFWCSRWPMLQDLPDPGPCRDRWGNQPYKGCSADLTVDHVHDDYGEMGQRAPDDIDHLWTLCHWHHIESSWATKAEVRAAARKYIPAANLWYDPDGILAPDDEP